ncbi:MAG: hypothetical protein ACJ76Y_27410 [Thermoanaerobaculia bacterium]
MAEEEQKSTVVAAIFNRYSAAAALIGLLITTVGYYHFLDDKVDRLVSKRLEPYQLLLSGVASNQGEDYDEAVAVLSQALKKFDSESTSAETTNLANDALLFAIVNSSSPHKYSPEFQKISARIGPQVGESPWRSLQQGWFYLRIGNSSKAKEYLTQSLQFYDSGHERKQGAAALRGLMLVSLAEGDASQAYKYLAQAAERSPLDSDIDMVAKDISSWPSDGIMSQLQGLYGDKFTTALHSLEAVLAKRPKDKKA